MTITVARRRGITRLGLVAALGAGVLTAGCGSSADSASSAAGSALSALSSLASSASSAAASAASSATSAASSAISSATASGPTSGTSPDACTLITAGDLASLSGGATFTRQSPPAVPGVDSVCQYTGAGATVTVSDNYIGPVSPDTAKAALQSSAQQKGAQLASVDGLGDAAGIFEANPDGSQGGVVIAKGILVSFNIQGATPSLTADQLTNVLRTATGHLG